MENKNPFAAHRPIAVVTDASHAIGQKIARHFVEKGYSLILGMSSDPFTQSMRENFGDREIHVFNRKLDSENDVHSFYQEIKSSGRSIAALALSERSPKTAEDVQIIFSPAH